MPMRNTRTGYGLIARLLHWLMAAAILFMFGLGLWMRSLDYYSPHYYSAPALHKSLGVVLAGLLVLRLLWRFVNTEPDHSHLRPYERYLSQIVHWGFYPLLLTLFLAGYLIPTADGRPIDVFGLFSVPATLRFTHQEDIAGELHAWLAYAVIAVAVLHTAGALKHHFIDRDRTLARMWRVE